VVPLEEQVLAVVAVVALVAPLDKMVEFNFMVEVAV
jgi:hypothetical protein